MGQEGVQKESVCVFEMSRSRFLRPWNGEAPVPNLPQCVALAVHPDCEGGGHARGQSIECVKK